jgi:hypothetical protein
VIYILPCCSPNVAQCLLTISTGEREPLQDRSVQLDCCQYSSWHTRQSPRWSDHPASPQDLGDGCRWHRASLVGGRIRLWIHVMAWVDPIVNTPEWGTDPSRGNGIWINHYYCDWNVILCYHTHSHHAVVSNRQGPTSRMGIPDHIGDRWSDRYLGCFTGLVWPRYPICLQPEWG